MLYKLKIFKSSGIVVGENILNVCHFEIIIKMHFFSALT